MSDAITQAEWRQRAERVLPAGGFGNFDPGVVITSGQGAHVTDADGKVYIDYLIGSGPMLVGHGHPEVNEAVEAQLRRGTTFFATNPAGIELAEVICDALPSAEQVRFVSTGSEADMYAMRLARAHTGREKILKFEGGYHGMSAEALMSLAPKRLENYPRPVPDSAGIPDSVRDNVIVAPFNDAEFARGLIEEYHDQIAGVIVEPLQRLIPPAPGFLAALRELTRAHGIVLIFDEVVTGFRLDYHGAQTLYGVTPDVTTLGKVIGGGFPLAAISGTGEVMAHFDRAAVGDERFTFQIGTLSGNPVAAVAGLKTLEILRRPGNYERMMEVGVRLSEGLAERLEKHGAPATVVGHPMLFDAVFSAEPVVDYRGVLRGDAAMAGRFNATMREHGILKPDSKFYPSLPLSDEDVEKTLEAMDAAAAAAVAG